jgi:hypothetical protein
MAIGMFFLYPDGDIVERGRLPGFRRWGNKSPLTFWYRLKKTNNAIRSAVISRFLG